MPLGRSTERVMPCLPNKSDRVGREPPCASAPRPALPPGTAVSREIASDEYEVYVQDSWQLRSNLTLTVGVRYSLYSPPYEVNGYQVAPNVSQLCLIIERYAKLAAHHPELYELPLEVCLVTGKRVGLC